MPLFTQWECVKVICSWNFTCSAKEAVILLRSWSSLYTEISKCIVPCFATTYPDFMYKSHLFLKFYVLCERSSDIASVSVCSIFKMSSLAVLLFIFWFATNNSKCFYKSRFSWNCRCSAKETVILLLSWSARYIVFSKCIVSWIYCFSLDLPLFTQDVFVTVRTISAISAISQHLVSWF